MNSHQRVKFEIVKREKVGATVQTVGTILPNEEVEIRSEISGKIAGLYFSEGSAVRKNQVLLKINDDELRAQLATAQYRQDLAKQQEQRQRQLYEKKFTSQQEYDTAVSNLNVVKSQVLLLRTQLGKTEIRAPFDGIIGLRFVSAGSYISPSTSITTLQSNDPVKVDFTFAEKYAGSIRVGDQIIFTVQGTTRTFSGSIYAIPPRIDPETRTLRVRAVCPNADGALIPGAFASVEVLLQEKDEVMIPTYAVIPELKGHKVFVVKDGKARERDVSIGVRTDDRVQITAGLSEGDTLITSGILQLRPGSAVRPMEAQ